MKTLAICIPSYNRFDKLKNIIDNILLSKSNDFEIVIIDNCSPKNIYDYIATKDKRVKIIKRRKSVGGIESVGSSILFGEAKYCLLLLDKDTICGDLLDNFLDVLSRENVEGGYCQINSNGNDYSIVNKETIINFGFLSKHPSGNFYRIDCLREFLVKNIEILKNDPFNFDIYLAYCASKGPMLYYNKELVYSNLTNIEEDDKKSYTFNVKNNNIYYFPKNRINEFITYVSFLETFDIPRKEKEKIIEILYLKTTLYITRDYKAIMKNSLICSHYGHETKDVTIKELLHNYKKVRDSLLNIEQSVFSNYKKNTLFFWLPYRLIKTIFENI